MLGWGRGGREGHTGRKEGSPLPQGLAGVQRLSHADSAVGIKGGLGWIWGSTAASTSEPLGCCNGLDGILLPLPCVMGGTAGGAPRPGKGLMGFQGAKSGRAPPLWGAPKSLFLQLVPPLATAGAQTSHPTPGAGTPISTSRGGKTPILQLLHRVGRSRGDQLGLPPPSPSPSPFRSRFLGPIAATGGPRDPS